jgi:uncharacterized protein YkwD
MKTFIIVMITVAITWFGTSYYNLGFPFLPKERIILQPSFPLLPPSKITTPPMLILEENIFKTVNSIRGDRDLGIIEWDEKLYQHSKEHSMQMAELDRLFHNSPDEPFAENCWGGGGADWDEIDIVTGWMKSDRHRTWLLNPKLTKIAVGASVSKDGDLYVAWTFWRSETDIADWWYIHDTEPPEWWY